jgi:membrane-associated protein
MAFSNVLDWLQELPDPALLGATGMLVVGEAIVGLGFVIPGEAALLIASATVGSVADFLVLWVVVTICSVVGNVIGFEIGRRLGPALRETGLVQRHGAERWDRATRMLRKHGAWAVFVGRLTPFVRSFVPAVAGAAGMSYRLFLPAVSAGAACASALPILFGIGVVAGVKSIGGVIFIVVALLVAIVVIFAVVRGKAKARKATGDRSPRDPDVGPEGESAG